MIYNFTVLGETIYIDSDNGNFSLNMQEVISHGLYNIRKSPVYSHNLYSSITFCLEISDVCNLSCSYCFNPNKSGRKMNFDTAKKTLDSLFEEFPYAQKYFADVSGAGEPLLSMNLIEQLSEYVEGKSDQIDKEVTLCLVSNGILLTTPVVEKLQKMNVLFGVSIDGSRESHNRYRKDKSGRDTYDFIIDQVKNISDRQYVGCAVTITDVVFDLNESITELKKIFKTISIKPVRSDKLGIKGTALTLWENEYEKLERRLESEIGHNDLSTLFCLLNGDDYFGKFIIRSFLDQKALLRCDCATGRVAVSVDGSFYPCPALINPEYQLGDDDAGFDSSSAENIYNYQIQRKECTLCPFRYMCGGECMALSLKPNYDTCEFKKHLILLSMILEEHCRYLFKDTYQKIYDFCLMKKRRQEENKEFREYRERHKDVSFTEAKKQYDSNKSGGLLI